MHFVLRGRYRWFVYQNEGCVFVCITVSFMCLRINRIFKKSWQIISWRLNASHSCKLLSQPILQTHSFFPASNSVLLKHRKYWQSSEKPIFDRLVKRLNNAKYSVAIETMLVGCHRCANNWCSLHTCVHIYSANMKAHVYFLYIKA